MNVALWVVAGVLAAAFLSAGALKLSQPKATLAAAGQGWVEGFPAGQVKAIGTVEVSGAVGLILPAFLDIAPILVPIAATGLALLMMGAMITHARRNEQVSDRRQRRTGDDGRAGRLGPIRALSPLRSSPLLRSLPNVRTARSAAPRSRSTPRRCRPTVPRRGTGPDRCPA
ncbi:MAG: DoxX family protein [Geodermatophilaceae bacterium]